MWGAFMFDNDAALLAVDFIQLLKHQDGQFYGQPFALLPWQHAAVSRFYGEMNDKGLRRYQYLYLEIPKKNGKSELAAALALYHLFADGEVSGEVYLCAADKDNASIVYNVARKMLEMFPALEKRARKVDSQRIIYNKTNGSVMKVMSAEAFSKHGYKPSCVIFDELHAQPNRALWDIMTFGAGDTRAQPVWIVLTTAGDDPDRHSIGWEQHEYARKVLDGEINDPTWLPIIYGAPEDADIYDERTWYAANPSLGHTIDIDKIRQEAVRARNSPGRERLFRWLRLNQWISLKSTGWLPLTLFDGTAGDWSRADLIGKRCYLGLDLGSTCDLTAGGLVFPPQDGLPDWRVLYEGWIPDEAMRERENTDKAPFSQWVQDKYMHATPGNATDYDFVEARVLAMAREYRICGIGIDKWNSRMLTQRLMREGMEIVEVPQNIAGMSPAMKEIERLLRTGEMTHEKHPVARWCFGNVKIALDGNENIKPMKNKSTGRIDITVAWINGMALAMQKEAATSVYETRGVRVV